MRLNEGTWIKTPPPVDLVKYLSCITDANLETSDFLKELLEGSGLRDVKVRIYKINVLSEFTDQIRRLDSKNYLSVWYRFLSLCIKSSVFRRFAKEEWLPPKKMLYFASQMFECLGYGIYVGRK